MRKAFLLVCAIEVCAAQSYTPGPQVLTFFSEVDDSDQPYALYLPKSFDPAKKYPLVMSLHGAGSNHRLNLRRVFGKGNLPMETDAQASRYFPAMREVEYIIASPYARGTMGYQGIPEKDVYDVLTDVKRRFPIDEDRVYLTGLSMGGGGTLWLGLTRPDIWAAIAPVCAATTPGAADLAGNALNVPVHLFHGDQDPAVPVQSSRDWHKRFLELGVRAEYVEYPGVRHSSWDFAYKDGAIFDWFAKFRRERNPARVRFSTRAYKYNSAYWVELDSFTPGMLASIGTHTGTLINAGAFIVVVFLLAFFGLRPMAAALTAPAKPAIAGPSFDDVQRSLPTPEATAAAEGSAAPANALPGTRPGPTPLDDLRQKIKPAPQERLARMVDLNEERTAQILRKWTAQEVAG